MGESLREVADLPAAGDVVFLGVHLIFYGRAGT